MTLRKCPACKNQIEAESEACPICGCNPTLRRVRSVLVWGVALVAVSWMMFHGHGHWAAPLHH